MGKVSLSFSNRQDHIEITTAFRNFVKKCCTAVLKEESFTEDAEVSVSFVSDEEIHELNREFRNKDSATDVLSFPLGEDDVYDENPMTGALCLGDIVISVETAERQAEAYGHSFQREIGFLTVHSMLHLLGYDHETGEEDEKEMHSKEEKILLALGVPRSPAYPGSHE